MSAFDVLLLGVFLQLLLQLVFFRLQLPPQLFAVALSPSNALAPVFLMPVYITSLVQVVTHVIVSTLAIFVPLNISALITAFFLVLLTLQSSSPDGASLT